MLNIKSQATKLITGLAVALTFASGAMLVSADAITLPAAGVKKTSGVEVIKNLQSFLNTQGSTLTVDGKWGAKTNAAIASFQKANGLKADGSFGKLSAAKAMAVMAGGSTVVTTPGTTPVVAQSGPITASVASDTPSAGTIVAGQATADLMHIAFSGSGTVNSVTLQRGGVSNQNTLTNVYLYDGVKRITDGYSFNTNGTLTINNLNLAVSGSKTISVKADVLSSSTDYDIYVTLTSFSAGTSVNTVSLKGNDMFIAGGSSLATIAWSSTQQVTGSLSVNAGTNSYAIWRQAVLVNTRALSLKAANFRISGSAPADALANVNLYVDGVKAGPSASMTMTNGSNYLSFDMMSAPVSLTTGIHTLEVRGDVVKGSSYNFTVSIQNASDLMVMDPQVGVNLALGSFTASTTGTITIGTGTYTVSNDPSFSAMSNITAGASNATIAKYKITGYGEDVKVTSITATPVLTSMTPSASGLQNVTLYFNGSQVGSQQGWTSGALTFSPGSQMIIPAGVSSILEVKADLRTTGGANYTAGSISANLGAGTAEGWSSKASITGPTGTGTILTVQSATLAVSKNAGYSNQNVAPNTAGAKIGSVTLQNQSSSESIRVTTLSVAVTYGSNIGSSNYSALRTSEVSGSGATPQQPTTTAASGTGTNTFSVDFVIAPGATKTIDILADASSASNAAATVSTNVTVSSIGVTSNVAASTASGANQTIAFQAGTLATPTVVASSSTVAQLVAAANGGSTDGSLAVYNFTSATGASTVSELTFTSTNSAATSVKIGTVSAPVVGGTAYLTGLSIAVPNGGSGTNVNVYVSYTEVGTNGIASATTTAITLTTIKWTSGNTTTTTGSLTVAAPTMILVGSIPTYTVVDSTETLINGSVKVAEVTVAASSKGDIKLGVLPLLLTSTGVATVAAAADNIIVKDTSGATIATKNASFAVSAGGSTTGLICFDQTGAACTGGASVANGYLIPAGTSKTFRIYTTAATVSGAVNTTSLSAKLGAASSATYYDVAGGASSAQAATSLFNYPTETSVISN
jgi:hypothetical protein